MYSRSPARTLGTMIHRRMTSGSGQSAIDGGSCNIHGEAALIDETIDVVPNEPSEDTKIIASDEFTSAEKQTVTNRAEKDEVAGTMFDEPIDAILTAEGGLPEISIPVEKFVFEQRTYIHSGRSLPVPEAHHIGEYKIKAHIKLDDLGLDAMAQQRLIYMMGFRYSANKRELVLTCEKFRSRVENKRYIIYQILELMRAASQPDAEFDESYRREQEEKAEKKSRWFVH